MSAFGSVADAWAPPARIPGSSRKPAFELLWRFEGDIVVRGPTRDSANATLLVVKNQADGNREKRRLKIASFSDHRTFVYWQTWSRPSNPLKKLSRRADETRLRSA